jgi:hypothetical protein
MRTPDGTNTQDGAALVFVSKMAGQEHQGMITQERRVFCTDRTCIKSM